MKIWHISDTHGYHNQLIVPDGIDMVIHSGDCSNFRDPYRNEAEVRDFIHWYKELPIKNKIYVAGNHDTSIEAGLVKPSDFEGYNIVYLEDEYSYTEGLIIFGSPYVPKYGNWSFMKERYKLDRKWKSVVPDETDILISHGPPKGVLDLSYNRDRELERCGDKSLLNIVKEVKPKLHLFGHIHNNGEIENAGTREIHGLDTIFSNGSVVTDRKFGKLTSQGNIFDLKN